MKYCTLLLFCLLLLIKTDSNLENANIEASKYITSFRKSIPRLTFTGKVAPIDFNPESGDYWQGLGTLSIFGFVCAVLAILFAVLFLRLRRLGLFGGYEPTRGCWKPCGEIKTDSYPKWVVVLTILFSLLFAVALIGVSILAIISNQNFHENFETARVTLRQTISKSANASAEIRRNFLILERLRNATESRINQVDAQLKTFVDSQAALKNSTSDLIRDIGRANKVRYLILIIICVICFLVPFLTSFAGVTCCKGVSLFGFKIATYALIMVWVGFAIHYPAAVLTSDFCTTVDTYVNTYNTTNSTSTGNSTSAFNQAKLILDVILKCQTTGAILNFQPLLEESNQKLTSDLNDGLKKNDPQNRTFYFTLTNCSNALDLDFVKANPNLYKAVSSQVNLMNEYLQVTNQFNKLLSCTFVADGFRTIRNSACIGGLSSMEILWVIFLVLGILMIPTAFLALSGYKLFRKQTYVKPVPKKEGGVEVEMVNLNGKMIPLETAEVV